MVALASSPIQQKPVHTNTHNPPWNSLELPRLLQNPTGYLSVFGRNTNSVAMKIAARTGGNLGANVRENHDVQLGTVANSLIDLGGNLAGRHLLPQAVSKVLQALTLKN